jgi:hypothetical protein
MRGRADGRRGGAGRFEGRGAVAARWGEGRGSGKLRAAGRVGEREWVRGEQGRDEVSSDVMKEDGSRRESE